MIKTGDVFKFEKEILEEEVTAFAKLTGDYNPLHLDENFAKKLPYKKRVVHGMLIASFTSRLVGMELSIPGVLWGEQRFRFIFPTFIGDRLIFQVKILHFSSATKSAKISIVVTNQKKQIVIKGDGAIILNHGK